MEMLDASPSFHFAGTFGHEGSTSNIGTSRARAWEVCAAASVLKSDAPSTPATMTNAIRTARLRFLRFMASLLYSLVIGLSHVNRHRPDALASGPRSRQPTWRQAWAGCLAQGRRHSRT